MVRSELVTPRNVRDRVRRGPTPGDAAAGKAKAPRRSAGPSVCSYPLRVVDRLGRGGRGGQRVGLRLAGEGELRRLAGALDTHHDDLAGVQLAVQDLLGQVVLDLPLDGATQRPGAENRVV